MKNILVFLSMIVLIFGIVGTASATTIVAGYNFDDNAFVDQLISYSGTYANNYPAYASPLIPSELANVLTDLDVGTYAYTFDSNAYVELGFTDNYLVNGSDYDLALFDLGVGATFGVSLTIAGTTLYYNTIDTGYTTSTPEGSTYGLNVARINLDDFGLASGALVSSIVVGMSSGDTPPSLGIVGALNSTSTSVPEPGTLLLLGFGLLGLVGLRRKE